MWWFICPEWQRIVEEIGAEAAWNRAGVAARLYFIGQMNYRFENCCLHYDTEWSILEAFLKRQDEVYEWQYKNDRWELVVKA